LETCRARHWERAPTSSAGVSAYTSLLAVRRRISRQGIANPVAAILSAALLCRYSLNDEASAARIEEAVNRAIASGARTRDLAREGETVLGTQAFTDRVAEMLVPLTTSC